MMIQEQPEENEERRSINNIIDTAYLSILIWRSSLSALFKMIFYKKRKYAGIESSHVLEVYF